MRVSMPVVLGVLGTLGLTPVLLPAVHAQTAPPSNATRESAQSPEAKFIQDLGDKAIKIIADKSLTKEQRTERYDDLLHDAFDIPAIGKFVLGRAWNTATPEQQRDYLKLFEALVVKTYGDRLNFYTGEGFHVKSSRPESNKEFVINSEITHPQGEAPTTIDWRVHQNDGKYAVIDVMIEGVSQSITQRQEYAAIIERNNGNINGLLDLMRERLQKPSPQPAGQ